MIFASYPLSFAADSQQSSALMISVLLVRSVPCDAYLRFASFMKKNIKVKSLRGLQGDDNRRH